MLAAPSGAQGVGRAVLVAPAVAPRVAAEAVGELGVGVATAEAALDAA